MQVKFWSHFSFEALDQPPGSLNLIRPIPQTTTVEFSGLITLAQTVVGFSWASLDI